MKAECIGRPIKVIMARTSLDGHWRGAAVVSTALRDAGMDVIYLGEASPDQIASAALQEDADVIGISIGGRYGNVQRLIGVLKEKGMSDRLVVAGGTIPPDDVESLKSMGVDGVFPPGSRLDDIVDFIKRHVCRGLA